MPMMMIWLRRVLAVGVIGTLLLTVAGCNRNYEILGRFALGWHDGTLAIAICDDLRVDRVYVSERHFGETDGRTVLEAAGEEQFIRGDVLSLSEASTGLSIEAHTPASPEPGTRYKLIFNDGTDPYLSAAFHYPREGIPVGSWLTPLDELTDEPCEAFPVEDSPAPRGTRAP